MSKKGWYIAGGIGAIILAWWLIPGWIVALIVTVLIAAPVVGYLMLDPSQRKRLRRIRRRQIGS